MARRFYSCAIAGLTVALGVALTNGPASGEPRVNEKASSTSEPATHAVSARRTKGSLRVSPGTALPGEPVTFSGKIKNAKKRSVFIQMSTGGGFKTILKAKTNRSGKFNVRWRLPTYSADAVPELLRFRGKLKGKLDRRKVMTRSDYLPKDLAALPASSDDQWHQFGNYLQDFTFDDRSRDGTWGTSEIHVWNPYTLHSTITIDDYVPTGWTVGSVTWTSAGTLTSPLLVADTIVRVPGSGITPAHGERHLYVFETAGNTLVNDIVLESTNASTTSIVGSDQGPFVTVDVPTPGSSFERTTRAYNVLTGAALWERSGRIVAGTFRSALIAVNVAVPKSDFAPGGFCYTLSVVNPVDGAVMRSLYTGDYQAAGADECRFSVYSSEVWGLAIDPPTKLRWYEVKIGYAKGPEFDVDGWTGADAKLPSNTGYADPFTNLAGEYLTERLAISDTVTGAVLFTPAPGLGAKMRGLMNGKVYLQTPDGTPVVDVATGRLLADNSSTFPRLNVGPWVLWSDNTVSRWPYRVSP